MINWIKSLRILALKEALAEEASQDYNIRAIFRWYSKTFSTPLHVVYDLPIHDVFQAFFEERYAELANGDKEAQHELQRLIEELSKTEKELELEKLEKARDDVFAFKTEKESQDQNSEANIKRKEELRQKALETARNLQKRAEELERLCSQDALGQKITDVEPIKQPQGVQQEAPEGFRVDFGGAIENLEDSDTLVGVK